MDLKVTGKFTAAPIAQDWQECAACTITRPGIRADLNDSGGSSKGTLCSMKNGYK